MSKYNYIKKAKQIDIQAMNGHGTPTKTTSFFWRTREMFVEEGSFVWTSGIISIKEAEVGFWG